jgi:hypothetical protein
MQNDLPLIEATVKDLLEVRAGLVSQLTELNGKLGALDLRIAAWQVKLKPESSSPAANGNTQDSRKRRTKKECSAAVEAAMSRPEAADGLNIRQIAEIAGLPWGTARNVLQRETTRYEERDGLWVNSPAHHAIVNSI